MSGAKRLSYAVFLPAAQAMQSPGGALLGGSSRNGWSRWALATPAGVPLGNVFAALVMPGRRATPRLGAR
jgi:hypothetical protein